MKILYASCYPMDYFDGCRPSKFPMSIAAQKYNSLMLKGFVLNDCDVNVIAFKKESEDLIYFENYRDRVIKYTIYSKAGNLIQRKLKEIKVIKKAIKEIKQQDENAVVVIDALVPGAYYLAKVARKNKLKIVSIVTDFIEDLGVGNTFYNRILAKIKNYYFYKQFKYTYLFMLLTEDMLDRIPVRNVKYIVANGVCDIDLENRPIHYDFPDKKICMYAGGIDRKFGIHNLVEAFLQLNYPLSELHLYGNGMDNCPELEEIISKTNKVKYFGVKTNQEILELQKTVTFLVNPRLVNGVGEYIKYSFPSKNIEYMTAGRPVITTKLPCFTADYDEHLYYFEDDSVKGMKNTLQYCFSLSNDDITQKAKLAREFIIKKLNNKDITKIILEEIK